MKAITRLTIGLASSLLLSAGLSRAAVRLDPLTQQLNRNPVLVSAEDVAGGSCALPCYFQPRPVAQPLHVNVERHG